jgi:NAD dependent epimerase/dehydratase family enzyme
VPTIALRLAFGREAAAFMGSGQRALPARLIASGYRFRFAEVEPALRQLLAAPRGGS